MIDLLIASTNLNKVRELSQLLLPLKRFDIYSLIDFPAYIQPEESGQTFEENALIKAEHAAKLLNKITIADDSGLVVPALEGRPGVFSARYAGAHASDLDNRKKLLQEMSSLQGLERAAFFECCIAIAFPSGKSKTVHGKVEGLITASERGSRGFGYDPLFIKYDYSQTFGELDPQTKNRISHRGKAVQKLIQLLETLTPDLM